MLDIILFSLLAISFSLNAYLLGKQTNVQKKTDETPTKEEAERERLKQLETERKVKHFNNFMSFDGTPQIP